MMVIIIHMMDVIIVNLVVMILAKNAFGEFALIAKKGFRLWIINVLPFVVIIF